MVRADRGFADREKRERGHTGGRGGYTADEIRRRAERGWSLSPEHQLLAERRGWVKKKR